MISRLFSYHKALDLGTSHQWKRKSTLRYPKTKVVDLFSNIIPHNLSYTSNFLFSCKPSLENFSPFFRLLKPTWLIEVELITDFFRSFPYSDLSHVFFFCHRWKKITCVCLQCRYPTKVFIVLLLIIIFWFFLVKIEVLRRFTFRVKTFWKYFHLFSPRCIS